MKFLAYLTYQEFNQTGMDNLLVYVNMIIPNFTFILLLCIFLAISISVYAGTRRYLGDGDIWAACTVGSMIASFSGILMTLKEGIISVTTLIIWISISIFCFIALAISKGRKD